MNAGRWPRIRKRQWLRETILSSRRHRWWCCHSEHSRVSPRGLRGGGGSWRMRGMWREARGMRCRRWEVRKAGIIRGITMSPCWGGWCGSSRRKRNRWNEVRTRNGTRQSSRRTVRRYIWETRSDREAFKRMLRMSFSSPVGQCSRVGRYDRRRDMSTGGSWFGAWWRGNESW